MKKRITAIFLITFCVAIPDSAYGGQIHDPALRKLTDAERRSLDELADYFANPHPLKRFRFENREGANEGIPTRIYRAWRMSSNRGYPPEVSERARAVLLHNPKLTLLLLKPIISEPPLTGKEMFVLTEEQGVFVPCNDKEDYISFCTGGAATEKDGFAQNILRELSKFPDKHISKKARNSLEYLKTGNYRHKSSLYKTTGDWKALYWLIKEYVRAGMHFKAVTEVLGAGRQISSNTYVYRGKQDHYLWLFYNDSFLESWEWRDKDKME